MCQVLRTGVPVEKGTKAVILVSFGFCVERTFNTLQTKFLIENAQKEFFNRHRRLHALIRWKFPGNPEPGGHALETRLRIRQG